METFKSILQFQKAFDTDEKCRKYLELGRWGNTPACPHCGSINVCRFANGYIFKCREKQCRKKFSATVGTVYESSKIPLTKWFLAMYIITNHSKGISSYQLAKWLDVTQKTAWFINHRIRESLTEKQPELLYGVVEIDESYFGGKIGNKHKSKRKDIGRFDNKTMVYGSLQRGGKVRTKVVPDTTKESLLNAVKEHIETGSIMVSDENPSYNNLKKDYKHVSVNHGREEYVRGAAHTNSLEGFWSLLKRQIVGIHHSVSGKHLQRYCVEASYRYNYRSLAQDERFADALTKCEGRLKYHDLINS